MIHFFAENEVEMKFNAEDFLSETFLFSGMRHQSIESITRAIDPTPRRFSRGEIIYSPKSYEKKIGFVLSGECEVCRERAGEFLPLNTIFPRSSFGITAIFADTDEFPTIVRAKKDSEIIFISDAELNVLMKKYPKISQNIIKFLSNRIVFLNQKVDTFSGSTVEKKLAKFLLSEYKRTQCDSFPISCTKTAEKLAIGRASLYRALSSLEEDGFIKFENKIIIIESPCGLERISK